MELTGKCKEDFEKWYNNYLKEHGDRLITGTGIEFFNLLTDSMQWGVYVDFFDSVGIKILIKNQDYQNWWFFNIQPVDIHETYIERSLRKTISEAREAAINKANEIYNDKHFTFPHDLDKLYKE